MKGTYEKERTEKPEKRHIKAQPLVQKRQYCFDRILIADPADNGTFRGAVSLSRIFFMLDQKNVPAGQ